MCIDVIVCNVTVVFLRHSVDVTSSMCSVVSLLSWSRALQKQLNHSRICLGRGTDS